MISDIILVFGRRGCGKTHYVKNLLSKEKRYLVLDPRGEYSLKGLCFNDFNSLCDAILKYRFNDYLKLIYTPSINEDEQVSFKTLCKIIFELGNITFVVEEIGTFMTATSCAKQFLSLVRLSRHQSVAIIGITQRVSDIPPLLRSQATKIISFQQIEPRDIDYLREFIDDDNVNKIKQFELYEHLIWTPDGNIKIEKPIKAPIQKQDPPTTI